MADPLSAVASAITVVGAALTIADRILSFVEDLRNAPSEVVFLQNDVTDTRLILSNIVDNERNDHTLATQLAVHGTIDSLGRPEDAHQGKISIGRLENSFARTCDVEP
jgi:hypothetical protein